MSTHTSAGARFRAALAAEKPLQIIGAINAYHAKLAEQVGYKALYLSGGGVAAGSLGLPDLGISTMDDLAELAIDELVELTPKSIRIRKRYLLEHERKRASKE